MGQRQQDTWAKARGGGFPSLRWWGGPCSSRFMAQALRQHCHRLRIMWDLQAGLAASFEWLQSIRDSEGGKESRLLSGINVLSLFLSLYLKTTPPCAQVSSLPPERTSLQQPQNQRNRAWRDKIGEEEFEALQWEEGREDKSSLRTWTGGWAVCPFLFFPLMFYFTFYI